MTAPDLYVSRVSPAGAVLDPSGVAINSTLDGVRDVALSYDGKHHVLAASLDHPDGGTDIAVYYLRPDLSVLYDAGRRDGRS